MRLLAYYGIGYCILGRNDKAVVREVVAPRLTIAGALMDLARRFVEMLIEVKDLEICLENGLVHRSRLRCIKLFKKSLLVGSLRWLKEERL